MTAAYKELLQWADGSTKANIEEAPRPRTLGEHFTASKEYLARDHHRIGDRYSVNLDVPFNWKAAGDPITMVTNEGRYIAPRGQMATFLDLIPEVPTTATTINFARESAFGMAVPVLTADVKTAIALDYSTVILVAVQTIAGWIKVTTDALDDASYAGYDITQRLRVAVTKGEEAEVIAGSGTSPHLFGMLSAAAAIASAASIQAGIGAVRGAGYTPNAILLNPANAASAITAAATSYAYGYDPFRGVEVLYGVPVYYSNAVPANTGIVGDLTNGCVIWRRQDATIIIGYVNDEITKNIVTIVGESRLAFYVTQSLALNKVTLT